MVRLAKHIVVGPWTLTRRLGSGGNAEVWQATRDGDVVALKVLRQARGEPYRRFQAETTFLRSRTTSDGILPLLDAHLPDRPSGEDLPWLAMPVAEPLRKALGATPPLRTVVEAVTEFADTLTALAAEGVGHRDIKPDNLFRLDRRWVIGDFGLVSFPGKEALTRGRGKLGPVHFIAPEMLRDPAGAAAGPADVYSLAKTLWVLAAGQTYPPPGEQRVEHENAQLRTWTAEPRTEQLDRLIERCTHPDPADRPEIAAVVDELRAWLAPPAAAVEPDRLEDLAERLREIEEPAVRREQRRTQRSGEFERTWERIVAALHPVKDRLTGTFSFVEFHGNPDLFGVWGLNAPFPSLQEQRTHGVICRTAGTQPIELYFGFGVQWIDGDDLRLVAGVRVEDPYAGPVGLWSADGRAAIASAALDRAIAELSDGLIGQLRPGVERALARVEMRLDRDRYASWGQMGPGQGEIQAPWAVFSSLGDEGCYIVDTFNNRIQRFGPGGNPIAFGPHAQQKGSGPGELDFPTGGCVDFDGNVWVADQDNRRIQQFSPTGELKFLTGQRGEGWGTFDGPCDVACDPAGFHYTVDRRAHKVVKGRGDAIAHEWGAHGRKPGELETPCGIAVRHGVFVYVSDSGNDRVQKFTVDGDLVHVWGGPGAASGCFRAPHGIALDAEENVYVADSENHRIQQFTSDGELIRRWGGGGGNGTPGKERGQFVQPRGVSVDGAGNLYVAEFGTSRIQRFGREYIAAL